MIGSTSDAADWFGDLMRFAARGLAGSFCDLNPTLLTNREPANPRTADKLQ